MFGLPIPSLTAIKWGAIGLGALALLAGGFYSGYRWELGKYETLVAADAIAKYDAVFAALKTEQAIAAKNQTAAVAAAQAQQRIVTQTVTVTKRIPTYVHDTISCPGLTVGLARVLRGAADGTDPASLSLAPGQSDDSCSDVTPSEVAGWFAGYALAARANTQQLSDLIAAVKANDAIATAGR